MRIEEFEDIMNNEDTNVNIDNGCNACQGLDIIRKYCPEDGIEGASHDIIFSVTIEQIVLAGITKEDAVKLASLNWMIDETGTGLACFV
jgi:hypothetical protein